MDLNEIPSDHMVNGVEIDEKIVANFDFVTNKELDDSRVKSIEQEQRCREVEEKQLALELETRNKVMNLEAVKGEIRVLGTEKLRIEEEIKGLTEKRLALDLETRNKVMNLEAIKGEIRVLGGEKLRIEEEIKGLTEKKTTLVRENVGGESLLDEWEVSRVDQLMVENKVLECEKNFALKEVEVWKRKCKELEARMFELEGRLKCEGEDGVSIGIKEANSVNGGDVRGSRDSGSSSRLLGAVNGVMQMEGTPDKKSVLSEDTPAKKVHVRRRLSYQNERNHDDKIAPLTPAGARPSSAVVDIIDSDNECDVRAKHRPNTHSDGIFCSMSEYGVHKTDGSLDEVVFEEEKSGGRGSAPNIMTPKTKRKRDVLVVTSDDECEDYKCKPNRRTLRIENSDEDDDDVTPITRVSRRTLRIENNDEDDDDVTPIRRILKRITDESEDEDDDDNIPISQLKRYRAIPSSTPPRRRLVKYTHGEQETGNHPKTLTNETKTKTKTVVDDESSEDESETSDQSLSNFIVNDSDDEDVKDEESGDDHDSNEMEETSDSNLEFEEIISRLKSRRCPNSKWVSEGDMLSDFGKNPELCMRAVCALYRQQTNEEKACKASLIHNGRGFSKLDAIRGTILGEFLTDGDSNGDLVKSVEELQEHHPYGHEDCRKLADRYSKQLFKIYENGEDPFFP
ncbi:uncharacterized protein [Spinacia oleracea]|uniref:Uncharacterized protein n=1 Tax=Spinacia oleracea TaxID=3562 RepID=A0A9R0I096_SPIOL|nr:uncharacterized protein LOC110780047 [Spinacia oleracea]